MTHRASGPTFYFVHFLAVGAYLPFMNVHFLRSGMTGTQVALLAALFPVATLLFAPLFARWADRSAGRVRWLQAALVTAGVAFVLLAVPEAFVGLCAAMAVLSVFRSPILSLADGLIARAAARHGVDYGRQRLWGSLGFAAGAVAFGLAWEAFGFSWMFPVTGAILIAAAGIAGSLEESASALAPQASETRGVLADPGLRVLFAVSGCLGLTLGIGVIFEGVLMDAQGGDQRMVGLFLCVIGLSEIPGMAASRPVCDRWGGAAALVSASVLFGGSFVGYALAGHPLMLLPCAVVRGLGFGLFLATVIRLIDRRAPDTWSASAQSIREAAMFGVAPLLAAVVAGPVYDRWGVAAVFSVGASSAALAAFLALLAGHRLNSRAPID